MKHALVTGSAGFVGRHTVKALEKDGDWEVTGIDLVTGGDVFKHIWAMTKRYDLVVHAAAQAPHRSGIDTALAAYPYNVALDAVMMNWATITRQRRFVYFSSCAAYPKIYMEAQRTPNVLPFVESDIDHDYPLAPFDVYGQTKLNGELMARQLRASGVATFVVRPFSGYGEDMSPNFPMPAFAQRVKAKTTPFPIWGNANQVRDWIHIDDVVEAMLAVVDANEQSPINLCTGRGASMHAVVNMLWQTLYGKLSFPEVEVDVDAPLGAFYRVGDPEMLHTIYVPLISLEEGCWRMTR